MSELLQFSGAILLILGGFSALFVILGLMAEAGAVFQHRLQERDRKRRNARFGLPYTPKRKRSQS